jgi:gamma-glutamylcyclotransferase (GGCT)/AIG2-like uncharacterized protein YtfP
MGKKLYIAYGSNLNFRQMAMRCPTAKLFGMGNVEGYELQFKGQPNCAFATIAPKECGVVPVAVWEIQPTDEKSLDIYEGYPSHYFKQNIPVTIDGKEINAMVYIMNMSMEFGIPTQGYYNIVHEGYMHCGLDTEMLRQALEDSSQKYYSFVKQKDRQFSFGYDESEENLFDKDGDMDKPIGDDKDHLNDHSM